MPVVALLNQKGGVGKTTLSTHIATVLAAGDGDTRHKVLLVDADKQHSSLDWAAMRTDPPRFPVVGMPTPTLHRDIPVVGRDYDWVIIDGAPGANSNSRSAIAASDVVLIPVQPSPYDVWAAEDIVDMALQFSAQKPDQKVRFIVNRAFPNTQLAKEVEDELATYNIPVLGTFICNRTEYAKSARGGLTVIETEPGGAAATELRRLVDELQALVSNKALTSEKIHAVSR